MEKIFETIRFYIYYWDSLFIGFPIVIRIVSTLVVLLAILYIVSLFRFIYLAYSFERKKRHFEQVKQKYAIKLKSILFSTSNTYPDAVKSELEIENVSFKKWEKDDITQLILSIKQEKKIGQINVNNYIAVIDAFGLISFWEENLRNKSLEKNMQALRMLDSLGINIPGSILANKVQGLNSNLRKYAKSEHIRFASHDAFKFLEEDFDGDLNPLDEIRIHASLKERAKLKSLPLLIRWVNTAQNEAYKCFLIKEIGLFNQAGSAQQLLELYQNTMSFRIKASIAEALGLLKYTQAVPILTFNYDSNPEFVQASIINAMGQFATPEALAFLEVIYNQTSDDELFIKIVRNIYLIDSRKETYLRLKDVTTNIFRKSVFANAEQTEIETNETIA